MPQYQVDSERIQSSSAAVATSISQIRQAVGGMYTNLNALQDAWRGSAATQFTAVAEQWRAAHIAPIDRKSTRLNSSHNA